jgi:hypothetical protein
LKLVLAFCLALIGITTSSRAGDENQLINLQTPSGNIHCLFSTEAAAIDCEIIDITQRSPAPERPADCDLEWGNRFYLKAQGEAELICTGDTLRNAEAQVVAYGETWAWGKLSCESAETGLSCSNEDGHGFMLSKAKQVVF